MPQKNEKLEPSGSRSSLSKKLACGDFSDRTRFPCAFGAAGETRRETLLRKASESTAHVAGFGFHSEGCGPPNLSEGFWSMVSVCPISRRMKSDSMSVSMPLWL